MLGVDCQIHAPDESGQADLSDLAIRQEQWTFRIDSKPIRPGFPNFTGRISISTLSYLMIALRSFEADLLFPALIPHRSRIPGSTASKPSRSEIRSNSSAHSLH